MHPLPTPSRPPPMHRCPPRLRPLERLERLGAEALTPAELLALVVGVGNAQAGSALDVAHQALIRHGGLRGLRQASLSELRRLSGVGRVKAARLAATCELARRLTAESADPGRLLASAEAVYGCYRWRLGDLRQEVFLALALDARGRLIREFLIAQGTLTACPVHPREVFRPLIREAAAACVVVHNHPSGDPEPSAEDVLLTRRLRRAGELLGVTLVDHVIVGAHGFVSFAERSLLQ